MAVANTQQNSVQTNKTIKKPERLLFNCLLVCSLVLIFNLRVFSQSGTNWSYSAEPQKVFIENKGQFHIHQSEEPVLFAFDGGSTCIYFTKKGISYSFLKRWAKEKDEAEREREREEKFTSIEQWKEKEAEEKRMEFESDAIGMVWENANPDVEIISYDQTSDYHSYCVKGKDGKLTNINYIKAFKKIVYKNIYPNIDIEYVFHPTDGLKYSLILHPGADISKIKMNYSGTVNINTNGDVHIATKFGDIIDHAPVSFYTDQKTKGIASHYIQSVNTISFNLSTFDNTKEVTIDPWTQTPTLLNSNGVWECERDGGGNIYIIGGDMPMKLIKYNAAGAIQWTYNTPYDTANYWLGTFATDLAGNSYVTAGSVAGLQKINTGGGLIYSVGSGFGSSNEYWNIAFNCDQTKLIIGGTSGSLLSLSGAIFDINTSNGSINSTQIVGFGNMFGFPPTIEEVRSITSCRNARYYFLTLDTIGTIDDDFLICGATSPLLFRINDGYALSYKCENYKPDNGNSGIMAIRANRYFVYTQNGINIQKRSLTDGSIITTAAIPGGINVTTFGQHQVGNSGIDIDSCGNVYVGSGNGIYKFDANLNLISSIATTYKVFDVCVSTGGNVAFCGATGTNANTNRIGTIQSANMSACPPMTLFCCDANICPVLPLCTTSAPVTLIGGTPGGTWSGPGVNASTGVFNPATAGAGTHTITYTLPCGTSSVTITVSICATLAVCAELNGNMTVSGGAGPYNWQNLITTIDCSACPLGTCIPIICPGVAVSNWTTFATGTTVAPSGTYPVRVIDNNGNIFTINSFASLPACSACPTLSITTSNIVGACTGLSTGSFSASTSGGTGPYDYTLLNGVTTIATFANVAGAQAFTGLAAGTYTLNVVDNNNCPGSITVIIPALTNPTPTIAGATTICAGSSTILDAGAGYSSYLWSTNATTQTITVATVGTYSVTISNSSGCTGSASVTVGLSSSLSPTIAGPTTFCAGNTAVLDAGIGYASYIWSTTSTTQTITINSGGTYSVTVTNSSGCSGSTSITVTQSNSLTPTITGQTTICPGSSTTLDAGAGYTGYQWSSGPLTQTISVSTAGTYTVTVSNASGCTGTASVAVVVSVSLAVTATASPQVVCPGNPVTLTATGGQTYVWNTSLPSNGAIIVVNPIITTTYLVTATDNGCTGTALITVVVDSSLNITTSTVNAACAQNNGSATANVIGSGYTFLWNTVPPQNTQTATGLSAGTYSVTVSYNGCSGIGSATVLQDPGPVAAFYTKPEVITINEGPVYFYDASTGNITQWEWDLGDGNYATGNQLNHVYEDTGSYYITLIVTDAAGCVDTAQGMIYIYPYFALWIPNGFTPNSDGKNEVFRPVGVGIDPATFSMLIYDRWGRELFSTTDINEGWNGTISNIYEFSKGVQSTYVYLIKVNDLRGKKHSYRGIVTLVQ
ncbi:MAG: PKD domain-containing protein [Bacteroidota bacterium]